MTSLSSTLLLTSGKLRNYGLMMAAMISAIFGLAFPFILSHPIPSWPFYIGGIFVAAALIYPPLLKYIYITWMKVGEVLGAINTRIILALVYLTMFVPIGMIRQKFGWDPLCRKFDYSAASYRKTNHQAFKPETMERPY